MTANIYIADLSTEELTKPKFLSVFVSFTDFSSTIRDLF